MTQNVQYTPEKPFRSPAQRRREQLAGPPPGWDGATRLLDVVKPEDGAIPSEVIATAADTLHAAVGAANEAADRLRSVDADADAELDAQRRAAAAGEDVPRTSDWQAEKVRREAEWQKARTVAREASLAYGRTVERERSAHLPAMVDAAAAARVKALKAVRSAEKELQAALALARAIDSAPHAIELRRGGRNSWAQSPRVGMPGKAQRGLADAARYLAEAEGDDLLSGRYAVSSTDVVPMCTREALHESDSIGAGQSLARLEAFEDYSVSSYTDTAAWRQWLERGEAYPEYVRDCLADRRLP